MNFIILINQAFTLLVLGVMESLLPSRKMGDNFSGPWGPTHWELS